MDKCFIDLPDGKIEVTEIIAIAPNLQSELQALSKTPCYQGVNRKSLTSISSRFRNFVRVIWYTLTQVESESLVQHGLNAYVIDGFKLLKTIAQSDLKKESLQALIYALKVFTGLDISKSDYSGGIYIELLVGLTDITKIVAIAPNLQSELQILNETPHYRGVNSKSLASVSKHFRVFVHAVWYTLTQVESESLVQYGLNAYVLNDFALLKAFAQSGIRKEPLYELIFALKLFTGLDISKSDYRGVVHLELPVGLTDITKIVAIAPNLQSELQALSETPKYRGINSKSLASVSNHFRVFVHAVWYTLTQVESKSLVQYGLNAYVLDDFALLKTVSQSDIKKDPLKELIFALKLFSGLDISISDYSGGVYLELPVGLTDITKIIAIAPNLQSELQILSETPHYRGVNSKSLASVSKHFRVFVHAVWYTLTQVESESLVQYSLNAYIVDDFALLKAVAQSDIKKDSLNELIFGLKLFTGLDISKSDYDGSVYIDFPVGKAEITKIVAIAPNLQSELQVLSETPHYWGVSSKSLTSVNKHFKILVHAIEYTLTQVESESLVQHSMNAFVLDDFALLKAVAQSDIKKEQLNELIFSLRLLEGTEYSNDCSAYIDLPVGKVDITKIALIAPNLQSELQGLSKTPNYQGVNGTSLTCVSGRFRVFIRAVSFTLIQVKSNTLAKLGLTAYVIDNYALLKLVALSDIKKYELQELIYALKLFTGLNISKSDYSGGVYLELPIGETDVTDLAAFSFAIIDDLKRIIASKRYQGEQGHNSKSMISRYRSILTALRYIIAHCDHANLLQNGFQGFNQNNFILLKEAFLSSMRSRLFKELVISIETLFDLPVLRHQYEPNLLPFYFEETDKWRNIDANDLAGVAPYLYQELAIMLDSEMSLLPEKPYGIETLHTRFIKLKRLINNYLLPNFTNELNTSGIKILGENNNKIQKRLFQEIQTQVQNQEISIRTGTSYFEIIRWIMAFNNQTPTDAFRISFKRYQKHAKRQQVEKTYNDNELMELVFHLEKAINETQDIKALVMLYFAKIQLKTCWNTAPMCDLELSDIKEIELPTAKKTMTIMVQKARKGYDVDTYHLDGRTVNSVMIDLQKVKQLTEQVRDNNNEVGAKYLFIYREYSILKRVE
ncbi:hypothetical protein L4D76_21490 [Photobacterium sagamiensis]|uniref:hypothetical protein n=1 Tax=Photobacterium sagamiensis TaxID=2910241 RepID=UPI003D1220FB